MKHKLLVLVLVLVSIFGFASQSTFALIDDILIFKYNNDIYKYDPISGKNLPSKLHTAQNDVKDISMENKNTLFIIIKSNNGSMKFKEEKKEGINLKKIYIPNYSVPQNKTFFSPDGNIIALIREDNINFFKWKSEKPFLTTELVNNGINNYCFSPDSKYFAWTEVNPKTKKCVIKKLNIESGKIIKTADINISIGFGGVPLPVSLYWNKNALWFCYSPETLLKTLFCFIDSKNIITQSSKKEFFMANNLLFHNSDGVWNYNKDGQLHFLFDFKNFLNTLATEWFISSSGNFVAVNTDHAFYIFVVKNNHKIKIFDKYIGAPSGKVVWNKVE